MAHGGGLPQHGTCRYYDPGGVCWRVVSIATQAMSLAKGLQGGVVVDTTLGVASMDRRAGEDFARHFGPLSEFAVLCERALGKGDVRFATTEEQTHGAAWRWRTVMAAPLSLRGQQYAVLLGYARAGTRAELEQVDRLTSRVAAEVRDHLTDLENLF